MMCSNCGKQEANFVYTEIINGVKKEIRLCSDCADKLGFLENMSFNMPSLDFSNFFGDFLNEYNTLMPSIFSEREKALKCSKCGMDYEEFLRTGKFGCSNCYEVFQERIEPLLKQLHGDTRFLGKKSNNIIKSSKLKDLETIENEEGNGKAVNNKLDTLKEELKQAVRVENYEKAAEIRDKINEIEGKTVEKNIDEKKPIDKNVVKENDINEDKKGE